MQGPNPTEPDSLVYQLWDYSFSVLQASIQATTKSMVQLRVSPCSKYIMAFK
jgi:hypothetical protein